MAAYPSLPFVNGSGDDLLDDLQIDRASNGKPRGRVLYTSEMRRFVLHHVGISAADLASVDAFYSANRAAEFDFTWDDGTTYTCIFARPPERRRVSGVITVDVELLEV